MKLPLPKQKKFTENTIPLINIVFLLLIFFVVAGTITKPMDASFKLAKTKLTENTSFSQELFITQGGTLKKDQTEISIADYLTHYSDNPDLSGKSVELAVDARASASRVIGIVNKLRQGGIRKIAIITEHAGS